MPCDTQLKQGETITQRKEGIRAAMERIQKALVSGRAKVKVGENGGVAFEGISDEERDRVTDACIYRRVMVSGSPLAKAAIAKAEQMAGRSINKQAVGQGLHSHDGGKTWHHGH